MLEYELQYCDTIPDIMNCIARFVSSFKCDAMYLVMDETKMDDKENIIINYEVSDSFEENTILEQYTNEFLLLFIVRIDVSQMSNISESSYNFSKRRI